MSTLMPEMGMIRDSGDAPGLALATTVSGIVEQHQKTSLAHHFTFPKTWPAIISKCCGLLFLWRCLSGAFEDAVIPSEGFR